MLKWNKELKLCVTTASKNLHNVLKLGINKLVVSKDSNIKKIQMNLTELKQLNINNSENRAQIIMLKASIIKNLENLNKDLIANIGYLKENVLVSLDTLKNIYEMYKSLINYIMTTYVKSLKNDNIDENVDWSNIPFIFSKDFELFINLESQEFIENIELLCSNVISDIKNLDENLTINQLEIQIKKILENYITNLTTSLNEYNLELEIAGDTCTFKMKEYSGWFIDIEEKTDISQDVKENYISKTNELTQAIFTVSKDLHNTMKLGTNDIIKNINSNINNLNVNLLNAKIINHDNKIVDTRLNNTNLDNTNNLSHILIANINNLQLNIIKDVNLLINHVSGKSNNLIYTYFSNLSLLNSRYFLVNSVNSWYNFSDNKSHDISAVLIENSSSFLILSRALSQQYLDDMQQICIDYISKLDNLNENFKNTQHVTNELNNENLDLVKTFSNQFIQQITWKTNLYLGDIFLQGDIFTLNMKLDGGIFLKLDDAKLLAFVNDKVKTSPLLSSQLSPHISSHTNFIEIGNTELQQGNSETINSETERKDVVTMTQLLEFMTNNLIKRKTLINQKLVETIVKKEKKINQLTKVSSSLFNNHSFNSTQLSSLSSNTDIQTPLSLKWDGHGTNIKVIKINMRDQLLKLHHNNFFKVNSLNNLEKLASQSPTTSNGRSSALIKIRAEGGIDNQNNVADYSGLNSTLVNTNTSLKGNFVNKSNSVDFTQDNKNLLNNTSWSLHDNNTINKNLIAKAVISIISYGKSSTDLVNVRTKSKRFIVVSSDCCANVGQVGNISHVATKLYKAGQNRWLGIKPRVRGEAQNAVDHPHGGRTRGGKIPTTAWGKLAKGGKTARKTSRRNII